MTVINTNIKSMVARDAMTINNRSLSTAMERLSTGKRINSASDDAAGLAIGTRMDAQVRGLNMAIKNANDTISVTQTAEGAMQEVTSILQRMRELAVQSSSDTNSTEDRAFLQQEVSQLSSEIDRISNTTQFNGMNLLDGSYANKKFQIGANQDQTIGMSIGRMNSNTLGVGSSVVGAPTPMNVPSANGVSGAVAAGTAAGPTSIKLGFSTNDTYGFTLADDVSGLTAAGATAVALDLTSSISKADFAKGINTKLAESAVDTKVTGSVTALGDATNVSTTPEAVKFSVSIGGGAVKNIDLKNRLIADATGTLTAVTALRIQAALQAELQSQFDTSVTVTGTNATAFVIVDAKGRSIDVTQGQGSGAIFGTDSANNGSLSAAQNVQTNLSVAWDQGNNLIVTNKAGGTTTLASYLTTGTATVVFDASASIPGQVQNPVTLAKTAASDPKVTANGAVEASQLAVTFSNRSDTANVYKFKLTDGAGHVYADLATGAGLDLGKNVTNATIIAAVKAALTTGTALLADKSITAGDFDVQFNGSTLTITNKEGLALAIENYTSDAGYATATPMNEMGKSTILAQKQAYTSEARLGLNVASLATSNVAAVAGAFDIWVDGIKSTAGIDFSAALTKDTTGAAIAGVMQTAIQAVADIKVGTTASNQSLANVLVTFDDTSGQMVIRDNQGRSISLAAKSTNTYTGSGLVWLQDGVTGVANKVQTIKTSSAVAQGQLYEQTKMDVTLSADSITGLNFKLNGVALGATAVDFTQPFEGSVLQTNLNTLMSSLNANHPTNSYEYKVSGRTITFAQRDGGALEFDNFATLTPSEAVFANVTPSAGQGTAKTVNYNESLSTAKALGNLAVATNTKLKINSPDLVSLSISDGSKTYSLSPTAIDITDRTSTSNFVKALNKSLSGSNIVGSMDLSGNIYLTDTFGGNVSLTSFGTASGQGAAWTPSSGQGDALAINSGYVGFAVAAAPVAAGGGIAVGAGGSSVSQMSIGTQAGASAALATIDKALSYVNAERSKLGAIENRLTHTVDNLTNIVTNTAASKSRIVDTDYATETTELARAQIIAQASTAMLAQANQSAQGVLSLLK